MILLHNNIEGAMVRPKCLTSPSLTMDLVHNIDWFIATSV